MKHQNSFFQTIHTSKIIKPSESYESRQLGETFPVASDRAKFVSQLKPHEDLSSSSLSCGASEHLGEGSAGLKSRQEYVRLTPACQGLCTRIVLPFSAGKIIHSDPPDSSSGPNHCDSQLLISRSAFLYKRPHFPLTFFSVSFFSFVRSSSPNRSATPDPSKAASSIPQILPSSAPRSSCEIRSPDFSAPLSPTAKASFA